MEEGGQLFQHRNSGLSRKMRLNGIWDGFSTAWFLLNVANNEVRQVGRCMLTLLLTQQAPAGIVPPSNTLSRSTNLPFSSRQLPPIRHPFNAKWCWNHISHHSTGTFTAPWYYHAI